jgi:hypothetical protein
VRRYDDPVQVRRGLVQEVEAPEQFVWRDRLWRVCAVVSHWVETGPWWEQRGVTALLGADGGDEPDSGTAPGSFLLAEREVWRVDATRGRHGVGTDPSTGLRGTFDLTYDTDTGQWHLTRCLD